MRRARTSLLALFAPLALLTLGGCSLVVDFDRSLLVDAGADGGVDAGAAAAADVSADAGDDVSSEALSDPPVDER